MFLVPGQFIAAMTFPGVVIHELAHQIFCRFFGVPVYEVCYFRRGNPAGYVVHGPTSRWWHGVLISAGPFLLNSALGALIAFPAVLGSGLGQRTSIVELISIWLGLSIAMHAIPSAADAKSMWQAAGGAQTPRDTLIYS